MTTLLRSAGGSRRCDGTCHFALGDDCRCICGGQYHGAGGKAAERLALGPVGSAEVAWAADAVVAEAVQVPLPGTPDPIPAIYRKPRPQRPQRAREGVQEGLPL